VWGLQDKVQANLMYDENTTKAVLSNLSVKLLGKANDPDTMKFYERFFELVKVDQTTISRSDEWFSSGQRRVSTATQEKAKHRGQEFMQLAPGEFFVFDEAGKSNKVQFTVPKHQITKPQPVYNYSSRDLEKHFDQLLTDCRAITQ
jgi:type IV secretory pathway TraG/TraD family ATPase VirD4